MSDWMLGFWVGCLDARAMVEGGDLVEAVRVTNMHAFWNGFEDGVELALWPVAT